MEYPNIIEAKVTTRPIVGNDTNVGIMLNLLSMNLLAKLRNKDFGTLADIIIPELR
jgi:hypothetical protein